MKPISRFLRRMRGADIAAERPIVVVVVLAEAASLHEAARPPEAETTPGGTLPHLDIERAICVFDDVPMAGNTHKAYVGELRRYAAWLDARPPTDRLLAEYLGVLYDDGLARSSAATAVAAVKRAALESARAGCGPAEPAVGHLAEQRLERFRREAAGRGRGQAGPLRWEDADGMCRCAEAGGDLRGIRDAALIGVVSSALLRVSEASALDAGDVSFRDDGSAHIEIRRGKTDQHGDGAVGHVAPAAAARLRKWMDTTGIESGPCSGPRPLFRPVPDSRIGEGRLGTAAIRAVVKRRAAQAGIARHVSGHSLRIGAALSLAERNVSVAEMQREGRWKSPSMPGYYVRNQEASRGAVARLRGGAEERTRKKLQKALASRKTVVLTSNNAS